MDAKMMGISMGAPSSKHTAAAPPPSYDPEANATNAGMTVGTCETSVRLGFLRKVYTLLTINIAITVAVACFFSFVTPVRSFVIRNPWLLILGFILGIGSFLALACIKVRPPTNVILLSLFIGGFSLMIGVICAAYYQQGAGRAILSAFVATMAVFISITVYICLTKKDFSYLGGFLLAATVIFIVLALLTFATSLFTSAKSSRALYFGISVLGALLATGYILYDTSLVVNRFGPDDWIIAVITLYTDVTSLFLYLLQIFSMLQQ